MDPQQTSMSQLQTQCEAVRAFISESPRLNEWPLCGEVLRSDLEDSPAWLVTLPMAACAAVGGEAESALPAGAAWLALRKAAHLMDAIQDGDELPVELKNPQTAMNCALALTFAAFRITAELEPPEVAANVSAVLAEGGFDSAHGYEFSRQESDPEEDLDGKLGRYWRETLLKSGSIYRAAVLAGAQTAGTPDQKKLEALSEYGYTVGVMLQILDDCRDQDTEPEKTPEKRLPFMVAADLPASGSDEILTHVARLISPILLAWKQRGQAQLARLDPSPAVDLLAEILEAIAPDEPAGETGNGNHKTA